MHRYARAHEPYISPARETRMRTRAQGSALSKSIKGLGHDISKEFLYARQETESVEHEMVKAGMLGDCPPGTGRWSKWSKCSLTCGKGVMKRERKVPPNVVGHEDYPRCNADQGKICDRGECQELLETCSVPGGPNDKKTSAPSLAYCKFSDGAGGTLTSQEGCEKRADDGCAWFADDKDDNVEDGGECSNKAALAAADKEKCAAASAKFADAPKKTANQAWFKNQCESAGNCKYTEGESETPGTCAAKSRA